MIDSLSEDQIEQVVMLGGWRDEGHLLAVSPDGEVSVHPADKGESHVTTEERERTARWQGSSGRQRAAGPSGAAAPPEPARQDGIADLRQQYFDAMAEVREFYPDLRVIEVEDGIWVVTQIFPIGRGGPYFSVCLFLPDRKDLEPTAFAFEKSGKSGKPIGPRHTNFPEASICAYSATDGVWEPGRTPLILLNLYAEWLVCQMFFVSEGYWPGRQSGQDSRYREIEFRDREWCDCPSGKRYGECCKGRDAAAVATARLKGEYVPLPNRSVPRQVIRFARSGWRMPPSPMGFASRPFLSVHDAVMQRLDQRTGGVRALC